MSSRGYQQHNLIVAIDSQYSWGGTDYSWFALKSGTTIPTGLSTSATASYSRVGSATDATRVFTFIIPTVFDAVSVIDGTTEGTIKLGVNSPTSGDQGDSMEITKASLTINAIDINGSSREISPITQIWEGSIESISAGIVTLQSMYWIDLSKVIVKANERIALDYTLTYTSVDPDNDKSQTMSIYCTQDTDETTITLPFVM